MSQSEIVNIAAIVVAVAGLLFSLRGVYALDAGTGAIPAAHPRFRRLIVYGPFAILAALSAVIFMTWSESRRDWLFFGAIAASFGLGIVRARFLRRRAFKLLAQLALAMLPALVGERLAVTHGVYPVVETIATALFVIGLLNALAVLNFIDGASSLVTFVAAAAMALIFDQSAGSAIGSIDAGSMVFSLALCGASLGFFISKRPPARAYMSDPGSIMLSFALALLGIRMFDLQSRVVGTLGGMNPALFIPLVLVLPVLAASVHRERMALYRRQRLALILIVTGHLPSWIPMVLASWMPDGAMALGHHTAAAMLAVGSVIAWSAMVVRGRALRGWTMRLVPEPIADVLRTGLVISIVEIAIAFTLGLPWTWVMISAALTTGLLIAQVTWWRIRVEQSAVPRVIVFGTQDDYNQALAVLNRCGDVVGGRYIERARIGLGSKHFHESVADYLVAGDTVVVLRDSARSTLAGLSALGDLVFASDCLLLDYVFDVSIDSRFRHVADRVDEWAHRLIAFLILIFLLPVCVGVMLAIAVEDGRPFVFSQYRTGCKGRPYTMFKFRSMRKNLPKQGFPPTCKHDPRITRTGRIIRKLGLDEIPQLWNVLRGDMRLVGPRPDQPFVCLGYRPRERSRLEVPPGLTGLWQLSPYRTEPIHYHTEYDFAYLRARGLLLDIAVCIATPLAALKGDKV